MATTRPLQTPECFRPAARSRRRGLSLPEVLISLAITAVLLTAVAAAFSASSAAIQANDEFYRATQAARISLNQMLTEVRRADSVEVYADRIEVARPDGGPAGDEDYRTFAYDAAQKRLTLRIAYADGTTGPVYTLASNVAAVTFGPEEMGYDADNQYVVARVPVTVRVAVGEHSVRLTGAAGPRRALK